MKREEVIVLLRMLEEQGIDAKMLADKLFADSMLLYYKNDELRRQLEEKKKESERLKMMIEEREEFLAILEKVRNGEKNK